MSQETRTASKKLTLLDLISLAGGQIIGAGVMSLLGIGIGFTGRSIVFAMLIAAVLTVVTSVPQLLLAGTAAFPGGYYTMFATLCNKKLAGIYTYTNLFTMLGMSFYALSFASYVKALFPGVSELLVCAIILTLLLGMHLVGIKQAARLQTVMMVILLVALGVYVVMGLGSLEPNYFDPDQFMTGGVGGFVLASVFLIFAVGGGTFIVNYSSEAKNPQRDIPTAMIVSTLLVAVFYAFIALVAAGTISVAEAANQPLSVSAAMFMPKAAYTFFVVGGAMFALLTSMNFSFGSVVFPTLTACRDGWLPEGLAKTNKRFGTNHPILLMEYVVALVPILLGIDMQAAANCTLILTFVIFMIAAYAAMRMPKVIPEQWARSRYHMSTGKLNLICITAIVVLAVSTCLLIFTSSTAEIVGNLLVLAVSLVLGVVVSKRAKVPVLNMSENREDA